MNPARGSGDAAPAAACFDRVARHILAQHSHVLTDLRRIVVLLPNYHVAQPLAQALMRAASRAALLLPQMITLNDWAQSVALSAPIIPDTRRATALYQALRARRWFEHADLWGMTQELLALFDELTHALGALPADVEAFVAVVRQAWQARQNETLQLEARLVFELWHAMLDGAELDAARAYQQRLALLAQRADQPLYVLRTSEWDALEQRFLDAYGQRADVTVFDLREGRCVAAGTPPAYSLRVQREGRCVAAGTPPAYSLRVQREVGGQNGAPRFFGAASLEQEASAAAMQVRLWLHEGRRDIAIVAQDRVVARRMRALLERAEVLVADETGWTFATLSVSTVLDRWLTALQSDFYHHDLLDLLKSPFVFADMAAAERKAVVYRLERLLRKHGVVAGLAQFIELAAPESGLHAPLARLRQAAALLPQGRRQSLAEWLSALRDSLAVLGIDTGLLQDDAGAQLLHAMGSWQQELSGDAGRYRFAEWRRWLAQQLDAHTYRDSGIDSSVRFTHLAATRWRTFDAVLLLGCDADHLPAKADGGRWFNDAVRGALNLPTRAVHAARQHDDLYALLALNGCVLVTWQAQRDGERRLLSPCLQLLRDAHQAQYGDDLAETALHACLVAEEARSAALPPVFRPAPAAPAQAVPNSISITAYNSLVACPYQFHARHILRLNELDEIQEVIEKRDFGERVHDILRRFHERYPCVSGAAPGELEGALHDISAEVFADLVERDFAARAWLARWQKCVPVYLAWQAANEAAGWRYAGAERAFELDLESVRLCGRIDRIDAQGEVRRVLDYKTQGDQVLRDRLEVAGEDVQLACYAYAEQAFEAAFVSIESGKVKSVVLPHDAALLAQLNIARLQQAMMKIRSGAGLPANGIDHACVHCEMRGVCRKGEWSADAGDAIPADGGQGERHG